MKEIFKAKPPKVCLNWEDLMGIEQKIYDLLSTSATIVGMCGTRIYPPPIPETVSAFPTVTYERMGGGRIYSLSGYAGAEIPLIQINIFATTINHLITLSSKISCVLEAATIISAVQRVDVYDDYDDRMEVKIRTMEFSIFNKE